MRKKLITPLLLICLAFSFGLAQAQTGGDNASQNMSQQENMSGNMSNVSFMLQSIESIRNNDTTGEKWFTYINGTQANRDFGLNNVSNMTNLSFWYTTLQNGTPIIENATYAINITVNITPLTGNQISNQTGGNQTGQNLTVLYNNTVNLTQGSFTFVPENSTQTYQVNNLTDIGALNATGLAFNASLMENMTGNMTTRNMTQNMSQNMTGKTTEVSINNFAFNPESVTISRGDMVRWANMDSTAHTVTSSNFDSGRLEPGASFEFTFTEPGTVEYHCSIHPFMQGNVTVMAA